RSFRLVLLGTAALLGVAAVGLGVLAWQRPDVLSVCFEPQDGVVCPTGTHPTAAGAQAAAGTWDVVTVEVVGLVAAALAAARSLRDARGSATPYGVPVALALVKLPSGAITAVVGLLLMRGE